MTEKITLELTLEELQLIDKYVEYAHNTIPLIKKIKDAYPKQKSVVEEAYKDAYGYYPDMEHNMNSFSIFQKGYEAAQSKNTEPYCPDEPEHYDEVEWDEKDNPKPVDEVVDRLIKKYQAQKLWNRVRDELGYSIDCCDEIVDLVESWLPEPQSAAGSQNVDTELLVDGFNHCLQKMKEMLR
jgi:oligoribonuclease (3'-5' exoribonuclease)